MNNRLPRVTRGRGGPSALFNKEQSETDTEEADRVDLAWCAAKRAGRKGEKAPSLCV